MPRESAGVCCISCFGDMGVRERKSTRTHDVAAAGRGPTAPPLSPELLRDALSGVPPDRRKTKLTVQETPLLRRKGEVSAAVLWGEEDASDALSGVPPDRRKAKLTGQETLTPELLRKRSSRARRHCFRGRKARSHAIAFSKVTTLVGLVDDVRLLQPFLLQSP